MYAATRQTSEGYVYYPIGDGSQGDLARLAGGSGIHAYIVRGNVDDWPRGQVEGDRDACPVLAEGWYDAGETDGETPEEFAERLFAEAMEAE